MFRHISSVFVIMAFSVFFGLLKNIFLAKELSKTDMGIFTLAMTVIGFIYPLTLMGQQNAFVRRFSKKDVAEYNWHKIFNYILLISAFLAVLGLIVAAQIYNQELDIYVLVFAGVAVYSTVVVELLTSVSRAKGDYIRAALLYRSIRFAFPIALLVLYFLGLFNLHAILIVFGSLYFVHAVIIAVVVYRSYSNGSKSVSKNFYIEGLLFLGSDLSLLVIITMDKFFLAKIMSLDELAVYFSIFAITRLYDLALQATEFVLMPYSNKMEKLSLGRILVFVTAVAIAITLFYLLFGEILLNLIYGDKYAEGLHLIPWFCAIGITRMFYCIPASIIGGRLRQKALRYLLATNTTLIIFNVVLVAMFISSFGLVGAVAGTLVVWLLRNIGAYTLLLKYKA